MLLGHLIQWRASENTCIVDQNVNPAKGSFDLPGRVPNLIDVTHIHLLRQAPDA
jgi:hypothetical protein